MLSRMMTKALKRYAAPLAALLLAPLAARAQDCNRCQHFHCPPGLKHCMEAPPHIHFQHGCPRPICNPCLNPNWGYYETCWNPWPWPPDFSHCRAIPPAATIALNPVPVSFGMPLVAPEGQPEPTLPLPRPLR